MIPKLDKWDSQILLLSKDHFREELKELGKTRIDALMALWADRCYFELKYVELGFILQHMIGMLYDLNLLNEKAVVRLLSDGIEWNRGRWNGIHTPMLDSLINAVLSELSYTKVKETIIVDGEEIWEILVEYEEKDVSFLKIYEGEKNEKV